jgi:hypothetical protein
MPTELDEVGVCHHHEAGVRLILSLCQSSSTFSIMATPKSGRSVSRPGPTLATNDAATTMTTTTTTTD